MKPLILFCYAILCSSIGIAQDNMKTDTIKIPRYRINPNQIVDTINVIISADIYKRDSIMYKQAYQYIVNDSINIGKTIAVSDSIEDLDWHFFSQNMDTPLREWADKYREKRTFLIDFAYYSKCLKSLFSPKNMNATHTLFFSGVKYNMILADLFPCPKEIKMSANKRFEMDSFTYWFPNGIVYSYLFVFNDDYSLKKVFTIHIEGL